jgi:hypothetical protein
MHWARQTTYPGFNHPGILYTKKQELRTDRQHKCQKSQKESFPEHMSPESKDRDFNTRQEHLKTIEFKSLTSPTLNTLNKFISTSIKVHTTHSK